MRRKLPPEAFAFYLSLGPARSYAAVADQFGVSKRAVTKLAARENWPVKLEESLRQVRSKAEEAAQESLEEMTLRHLKTLRVVQSRALEAMRSAPIASGTAAMRTVVLCVEKEREFRTDRGSGGGESAREYAARVRAAVAEMERVSSPPTEPQRA